MAAGFDYVELPAGRLFWDEDIAPEEVRRMRGEATNLFVSGPLKLVGPDRGDIEGYVRRIIPRAAAAGIKVMVVGSGGARKSPPDYDLETAYRQFLDTIALSDVIARPLGVTIAPESLQREETNVGNSMGDLSRRLIKQGSAFTADIFHLIQDWRWLGGLGPPTDNFWAEQIPAAPAHVHFADSDRSWHTAKDDAVQGFVRRLKRLGYDGRVSLECATEDLSEALAEAKEAWGG